ncbi:MAG: hypothetical protein COA31_006925 [Flavobacteriales bacterium]|nr:hypothetical protein [Flavobacteriales bacterium]
MMDIFMKGLMISSYRVLSSIKYYMLWLSTVSFCLHRMANNLISEGVVKWFGATLVFMFFHLLFEKLAFDDFKSNYLLK